MFLSAEGFPQAHRILGIINATSHLTMPTGTIGSFESMDQLFSNVREKLKRRASEEGTDGVVGVRFTMNVANMQVVPEFLVLTTYGTMIQFVK